VCLSVCATLLSQEETLPFNLHKRSVWRGSHRQKDVRRRYTFKADVPDLDVFAVRTRCDHRSKAAFEKVNVGTTHISLNQTVSKRKIDWHEMCAQRFKSIRRKGPQEPVGNFIPLGRPQAHLPAIG
jgi:hypothetical protein